MKIGPLVRKLLLILNFQDGSRHHLGFIANGIFLTGLDFASLKPQSHQIS
jgi:hypothetical protein